VGIGITALTFEEWIAFAFDRRVTRPEWYFDDDADWWSGSPGLTVAYLTGLFEEPGSLMSLYSPAQVSQGLWYLVANGCSDSMCSLLDGSVPWADRRRAIDSIGTLNESLLAKVCSDHLSHRDRGPDPPESVSPLNLVCYMWWDLFPSWGNPADASMAATDAAILGVLRRTLHLPSTACREGALHGLGHWHLNYPGQVERIIDDFLARTPQVGPELREYAMSARGGCVL
jgi:hypothetical protein